MRALAFSKTRPDQPRITSERAVIRGLYERHHRSGFLSVPFLWLFTLWQPGTLQ
jgi:hypothetical protein